MAAKAAACTAARSAASLAARRRGGSGRFDVSYHRYGSHVLGPDGKPQLDGDDSGLESSFYDGIDTSLPGIATLAPEVANKFHPGLEKLDALLAKAQHDFDPPNPRDRCPPFTTPSRASTCSCTTSKIQRQRPPAHQTYNLLHELHVKRVQLNNALVLALGLALDATAPDSEITLNSNSVITTQISKASNEPIDGVSLGLVSKGMTGMGEGRSPGNIQLPAPGKPLERTWQAGPDLLQPVTRPFFFRTDIEQPFYQLRDSSLPRDAPQTPPALVATAEIKYHEVTVELRSIVRSGAQPVCIVPPLGIYLMRGYKQADAWILPNDRKFLNVSLMKSPVNQPTKSKTVVAPAGWRSTFAFSDTAIPGETRFQITAPMTERPQITIRGQAELTTSGQSYSEGYRAVGYPGLTYTNYYTPATARVVPVDVTTAPNLNIAYIPGTGDDIPSALDQLGVGPHPQRHQPNSRIPQALRRRHPRCPRLRALRPCRCQRRPQCVRPAGGIVIAQYNTGRLPQGTGPYPLDLGGSQTVIEEDAPVKLVGPTTRSSPWPNKITTADFDGWVEERGHGFMATWDPHYTPLLETHDHGQQPQLGGLLVARTGRGAWTYLGLAVYRQLPEGVPGSYRLLANLVGAAKNPGLASPPSR